MRRPLRSALTLLALATAIAAVVSLQGISRGFTRSFGEVYTAHSVDIVVSRSGSADRLSSSIDQTFAEKIAKLPGVHRTAAVLLETLSLEQDGIYGIPSMGIAADSWLRQDYEVETEMPVKDPAKNPVKDSAVALADARPEVPAEAQQASADQTVWLGVHLAQRLDTRVGETISLFDEPYRVDAIFESPSVWENGAMLFTLDQLQKLTDRAGQATYINVVLDNTALDNTVLDNTVLDVAQPTSTTATSSLSLESMAQQVIHSIEQLDNKLLPLATQEFVDTDTRMQLAGAMAWMTSTIALILGVIGTLNTMLASVMERTREIGILRALGWPKRRVVSMILCESCGLAFLAGWLGSGLALLMTRCLAQAPIVKGVLSPAIDASIVVQGFVLAIGIGLLGALLPAWRAAQMSPIEAFREL